MTNKLDIARAYANLISIGGDFEAAAGYFSADFQNFDKDGNVALTKESWLVMARTLMASFTDYGFVVTDLREEGDFVIMTGHNEGTLTSDLDLSAMGMGVVPATGQKIVWSEASAKITVEGDKIVSMEPYAGAAGLKSFLSALGLEPPSN